MEPRPIFFTRRARSRRAGPSRRARRIGFALGGVALALAAGVAAWHAPVGPLAPGAKPRVIASASLSGLARLIASPPNQRMFVFSVAGALLLCIPLASALRRRRQQARQREEVALEQRARAPQIFEASLAPRPLRRVIPPAVAEEQTDRLPASDPLPPEVVARAAELQAVAVREAAARALMLRAASERSETRRRAAALRARARRERAAEGSAPVAPERKVAAIGEPRASAGSPRAGSAPPRPAPVTPAAATATRPAPRPSAPAPQAGIAAAPHASEAPEGAPAGKQGIGRVTILRSSGPLTFEWLEQCLARDPSDIQARLDLCTALLVAERFADAERVAREGLERDASNGLLLLRRSEALAGLERIDEALESAVHAVRAHRSRKAILHLTRLSAVARRFSAGDGARLRKALEGRPSDPVFLHALGAFEVQRGRPREALPILRLALRQERNPRWRRVVSREIAQLRADELADSGGRERRAAS